MVRLEIVGVAHISPESIESVENIVRERKSKVVAIELCPARYMALQHKGKKLDFSAVKKVGIFASLVNYLLSHLQKRVGDEVGIQPGKEMQAALKQAKEIGAEVMLIDRDIKITLRRILHKMGFAEKLRVFLELFTLLFREVEVGELGDVTEPRVMENLLSELRKRLPGAYSVLVEERDMYMAHKLLELSSVLDENDKVIAVMGAGHVDGVRHYLKHPESLQPLSDLLAMPGDGWKKRLMALFGLAVVGTLIYLL